MGRPHAMRIDTRYVDLSLYGSVAIQSVLMAFRTWPLTKELASGLPSWARFVLPAFIVASMLLRIRLASNVRGLRSGLSERDLMIFGVLIGVIIFMFAKTVLQYDSSRACPCCR
jgi:hypothetical protein